MSDNSPAGARPASEAHWFVDWEFNDYAPGITEPVPCASIKHTDGRMFTLSGDAAAIANQVVVLLNDALSAPRAEPPTEELRERVWFAMRPARYTGERPASGGTALTEEQADKVEVEMRAVESDPATTLRQMRLFMQHPMPCGHAAGNLLTCDMPPFGCVICTAGAPRAEPDGELTAFRRAVWSYEPAPPTDGGLDRVSALGAILHVVSQGPVAVRAAMEADAESFNECLNEAAALRDALRDAVKLHPALAARAASPREEPT